ncbi:MAG: GAF domain-containing protein [Thermoanaerobaculia bacterium]|nr:GAF domain-containing protein [Thermoanaerobaculia bacterium]
MNDRKILILGSDQAVLFPLAGGLRRAGWLVLSAHDAETAMSVARKQRPAAVVIDSQLADGADVEALTRLRAAISTTLIPAVCIVPTNAGAREKFAAAGAQEFIEPPGDPSAIDAALRRQLGRSDSILQVPPAALGGQRRAEELSRSQLLDSPRNEWLDRLTVLTAKLLRAPTALVSVVDAERQFFKSQTGLPEPFATERQTPLSHSFCQWVVGSREELVVSDAREHPVLRTNGAVRDLNVIAYAGVPFSLARGAETLGSFCILDTQPRIWAESELATLRSLSLIVQSYVATGSTHEERSAKIEAVASGIGAAVRLLQAVHDPHRREFAALVENQSQHLVRLLP